MRVQDLTQDSGANARMFRFSDGACGLTVGVGDAPVAGLTTFVVRGGRFEPYISTAGQGFGQRPDPALFTSAQRLEREAQAAPNVDVGQGGSVVPRDGAKLATVDVASDLAVDDVAGSDTGDDRPYVLDESGWETLSSDEQMTVVATYAADERCPVEGARRIAEALRDDVFVVVEDSVETTLSRWCAGESPASSESESDSDSEDAYTQAAPIDGCKGVTMVTNGISCQEAQEVLESFNRGEGVYGGTSAAGTQVGDWNCTGAKMSQPSMCSRGDDFIEADNAIG